MAFGEFFFFSRERAGSLARSSSQSQSGFGSPCSLTELVQKEGIKGGGGGGAYIS